MADFQFFLNRQGPRGPQGYKGDKGDDGKTPVPRTGTNTPIETTVIFDTGDGNPYETPNLKYPIEDRGGNVVMLDRTDETQYYGTPDQATDNSYGIVKLATPESVLDDPLDNDVVTYKLFDNNNKAIKATTDDLAGDITQLNTDLGAEVANRTNADTQLTNKINTDVGNEATARSNADIALSGRIDDLTTSKADKSDVYTKTQTDSLLNNKSNVGHTHNYNDLTNKPDIGNGTITFRQGDTTIGTITTNQLSNSTLTFADPTGVTPGDGLDLDSSTNTLSVKIDNDTLGINSDGEIEVQNAGTTYTAGDGIDLTNDTISVRYDNSTLKLNSSGQLYADIPAANDATITITQGGVAKGTFTTNQSTDGTIALDAGPDMSSYYTKTQTDSLLDEKIDNNIVQYPLQFLLDTTSNITLHNINSTTLTDTRINGYVNAMSINGGWNHRVYLFDSDTNNYINLAEDANAINLPNLSYVEISLANGFNLALNNYEHLNNYSGYIILIFGSYSNNVFIPKIAWDNYMGNLFELNTDPNNNTQNISGSQRDIEGIYKSRNNTTLYFSGVNNSSSGNQTSTTITQDKSDIIDKCTHARIFCLGNSQSSSNCTIDLTKIKIVNPNSSTSNCASGNISQNYDAWNNSDNIFDVHPASLSLKYDSTTLGVNANNELTVPTATTSNKGLVKPDGTTITINNGVISAAGSTPSNMVTTNTSQIISGEKKFTNSYIAFDGEYGPRIVQDVNNQVRGVNINYQGINLCGNGNSVKIDLSSSSNLGQTAYRFTIFQGNNKTYFNQDEYITDKRIFRNNTSSNFLLEKDMIDGTTIIYDTTTGKISAAGGGGSASIATSSTPGIVQPDNSTITVDSNGVISATGGAPSNMVTTDTGQDISGTKTFRVTTSNYTPTLRVAGYNSTGNNDFIILNSNDYTNPAGVSIGYNFNLPIVKVFGGTSGAYSSFYCHGGIYRSGSDTFTFWKDYTKNSKLILKNYQDIIMDSSMLDGTYLKWDSTTNKITVDIQAIKDAIDALSSS